MIFYKNFYKYFSCIILLFLAFNFSLSKTEPAGFNPKNFNISPEELKVLESLVPREELIKALDDISKMTDKEFEDLEKWSVQKSKEMQEKNIDLNDTEQLINFLSPKGAPAAPVSKPAAPTPSAGYLPTPAGYTTQIKSDGKEEVELTKNPLATGDVGLIIKEILQHIAELRQKASSNWKMSRKIKSSDFDELVFYLNSINKPELRPYISSQEFSPLYNILHNLHRSLVVHEPRIVVSPFFEDDEIENPYKELKISPYSTEKQIDQAFKKLKNKYDPKVVSKSAKFQKLSKSRQKQELNKNRLILSEIVAAYETLKNPKEKESIDKQIEEFEDIKNRSEQLTDNNFEILSNILNDALYRLIKDIQNLLQKYAPQEKKKADQWEALRKAALDSGKAEYEMAVARGKTAKIVNIPYREEIGEKYWREYRPSYDYPRNYPSFMPFDQPQPSRPSFVSEPAFYPGSVKSESPKTSESKKESSKSESSSQDSEKGGKASSSTSKSAASSGAKTASTQAEGVSELEKGEIASLLHAKDLGYISKQLKDDEFKPDSLVNLFKQQLSVYVASPLPAPIKKLSQKDKDSGSIPTDELTPPVLKKLDNFIKNSHIFDIETGFEEFQKKLSKASGPTKEVYKKIWQEVKNKFGESITKLGQLAEDSLDPRFTAIRTKAGVMNSDQERYSLLDYKNNTDQKNKLKELKSSGSTLAPYQEGYLAVFKSAVDNIVDIYKKINKTVA